MAQAARYGEATVNFAADSFRGRMMPPPEGVVGSGSLPGVVPRTVQIYDARSVSCGLARTGFDLVAHNTAVADFLDDGEVESVLYREVKGIVAAATGCRDTIVLGYQRRNGQMPKKGFGSVKTKKDSKSIGGVYARGIHADMTPFGHGLTDREDKQLEAAVAGKHYMVLNVWRSTDMQGDIEMAPLALCDMATVAAADMVHARFFPPVSPIYRLAHGPGQRFYVFPRMSPREALIFKQYDTREEAPPLRQCFHTAIDDPRAPPRPRRRESIEVRVVAVFGDDADAAARGARRRAEIPAAAGAGKL